MKKLKLSMIVKNEENRYLKEVLTSASKYVSEALIIDDGSTDNTVRMCKEILKDIPLVIIENKTSKFHNESELRRQQWDESIKNDAEWIIFLDADELMEESFEKNMQLLLDDEDCYLYSFRLYDFWDEFHYRDDELWCAHKSYRPFLLRYKKDFEYEFNISSQHCGRMPANVMQLNNKISNYRLKHLGWSKKEDRINKYKRYMELDPEGKYGSLKQYESILDENPNLVKFEE